jgi:hypothetical protein
MMKKGSSVKIMQKTLLFKKCFALIAIIFCFVPAIITPIMAAQENNTEIVFKPNGEDEKLRRIILYKKGSLGNLANADTFHMKFKAGKEYIFWSKIDISEGWFGLSVFNGEGDSKSEEKVWDTEDPESERKITYYFTPDDSGDHSVSIYTVIASDGGDYRLYVNRSGFAGYWWMIAAGVGAIAVLIFLIAIFVKIIRK